MTFKLLSGTLRKVPSNVQLLNSNSSQSFGYRFVKDHGEEGGEQVGDPGDHEGV